MSSVATTPNHPLLDLLGRYLAVLRAAWAARGELAGPKRLAEEAAFLPGALSLQETPVHPAPRRAMWVIMALFVVAFTWSIVGQVDIVAVAPGRIIVSQRSKVIQPLETSVVRAIHVKDGDRVSQGQLLVELDPTASNADHANVAEQQLAARGELARSRALLAALASHSPPTLSRSGEPLPVDAVALLLSEWSDISAKRMRLAAEAQRKSAELTTHQEHLAKLNATAPLVRQREADFTGLAEQGFVAGHAGQDRTRERIEIERDIVTQTARIAEAEAAVAESRHAAESYVAETSRALADRAAQAKLKLAQFAQEVRKTAQRQALTRLTAPVAGTVQQLAAHTPGGVVTAAQALMVIVPGDGAVTAEVVVENKDVGFVRDGQEAVVKIETFNFARYGTVPARVSWVSADAVNDEKRGAIFMATLELQARHIDVDGKLIALAPGMSVTGEIKTRRRRVIDYLLSPVERHATSSLRER